jgi:hypothetical protein
LSAGGGGADSGARTQAALTPADYEGFRQNANEQSRHYALAAVLAPLRYPVVVGVIAFGLLNPDPAYAPTPQTTPEDRPGVLERAGETGLAVVVGAVGIKLGQIGSAPEGVSTYEVGTYDALRARSAAGDGLDLHHVGQAHAMEQIVPGYSRATGPAIALPAAEHAAVPTLRGTVDMSPRSLLARDIWNLRQHTNTPDSSLLKLIELNKTMYPEAFAP